MQHKWIILSALKLSVPISLLFFLSCFRLYEYSLINFVHWFHWMYLHQHCLEICNNKDINGRLVRKYFSCILARQFWVEHSTVNYGIGIQYSQIGVLFGLSLERYWSATACSLLDSMNHKCCFHSEWIITYPHKFSVGSETFKNSHNDFLVI